MAVRPTVGPNSCKLKTYLVEKIRSIVRILRIADRVFASRGASPLGQKRRPRPRTSRFVDAGGEVVRLRCYGVVMRSALARSSNAAARAVSLRVVASDCECPAAALANVCLISLTN